MCFDHLTGSLRTSYFVVKLIHFDIAGVGGRISCRCRRCRLRGCHKSFLKQVKQVKQGQNGSKAPAPLLVVTTASSDPPQNAPSPFKGQKPGFPGCPSGFPRCSSPKEQNTVKLFLFSSCSGELLFCKKKLKIFYSALLGTNWQSC